MNPADLRYAKTHEWARLEGDLVTIGISKFAVEELADLVFLDLPDVGSRAVAGEAFGEIESVKAVSDLNSPVDGEIVEVNAGVADQLDDLANDPFGAGWLVKIRCDDPGQLEALLTAEQYEETTKSEDE